MNTHQAKYESALDRFRAGMERNNGALERFRTDMAKQDAETARRENNPCNGKLACRSVGFSLQSRYWDSLSACRTDRARQLQCTFGRAPGLILLAGISNHLLYAKQNSPTFERTAFYLNHAVERSRRLSDRPVPKTGEPRKDKNSRAAGFRINRLRALNGVSRASEFAARLEQFGHRNGVFAAEEQAVLSDGRYGSEPSARRSCPDGT